VPYYAQRVSVIGFDGYSVAVENDVAIPNNTDAILTAGTDGYSSHFISTDGYGHLIVVGDGVAGAPSGGIVTVQGVPGGEPINVTGMVMVGNPSVSLVDTTAPSYATYVGGMSSPSPPSYASGDLNPLSLNTAGGLRVDGSGVAQPVTASLYTADAFHRFRVSLPVRQWSSMAEYPSFEYLWESASTGAGSVTWQQYLSDHRLSTGGTSIGDTATRQTRRYMRYQPGRSLLIYQTFVMSAPQTNAVAEIGYYDGYNGIFLQRSGSALNIIRRTNVTGTPVDNIVPQSSWNMDRLNGTGPSGITYNPLTTNMIVIDLQWLGVGTVRVGFDFGDSVGIVWAHVFTNQNTITTVYMSTGCLPLRTAVYNTATASGIVTLDSICSSVMTEGTTSSQADTDAISELSASNGANLVSVAQTLVPIMSVRAATQYGGTGSGGQTNRGWVVPIKANIYCTQVDIYYEVWANATLTGASFAPQASYSIADFDTSATAINTSQAVLVTNGYVSSSHSSSSGGQLIASYDFPLVYSGLNMTQDMITIAAVSLTSGSNGVGATITWEERY